MAVQTICGRSASPEFAIEFAHRLDHLGPDTEPDTLVRPLRAVNNHSDKFIGIPGFRNTLAAPASRYSTGPTTAAPLSHPKKGVRLQMRGYKSLGLLGLSEQEEREGIGGWGLRIVPRL